MSQPLVSVVLPVYNAERFLNEAINSILAQTYPHFELLLLDDASTDTSQKLIASYKDERIRAFYNETNKGLVHQLNKGIAEAKGQYIARMDADDIAHTRRLEKQVNCMEKHPDIGVCGTWAFVISEKGQTLNVWKMPQYHAAIKAELLEGAVLCHPTVMMRADMLHKNHIHYDALWPHVEDYELWTRLIYKTKFHVIPQPLLYYRNHNEQVSRAYNPIQKRGMEKLVERQLQALFPNDTHLAEIIQSFLIGEWQKINIYSFVKNWKAFENIAVQQGYQVKTMRRLLSKRLYYWTAAIHFSPKTKLSIIKKFPHAIRYWSFKQFLAFLKH